jgi:spore maturation protein CgeB
LKNIEVTGRLAEGENMSRAFHGASICLNILTLENSDRTNVRNLEIAACGGFQLCERTDEVLELFEEHKEMACYEKIDELIDKCQYYLARPSERQQVAAAGHKRVMAGGHTYADRVHEILVLLKEL